MSHIHGISGSTKYLLNGTQPVNGKRFETLDQMQKEREKIPLYSCASRNSESCRISAPGSSNG